MRAMLWLCVGGCLGLEELNSLPDLDLGAPSATTPRQWTTLTAVHPDLGRDLALESIFIEDPVGWEVRIDVALGEQIGRWDGAEWRTITGPAPGLRSDFHRVSDSEIFAVIGETIAMWNGADWFPITTAVLGLQPAFIYRSPVDLFAVVQAAGQSAPWVERWNGNEWIPYTTPLEGLSPYVSLRGDSLYAAAGDVVRRWDGVRWLAVSDPIDGLGPSVISYGDDNLTALVDNAIWRWDGDVWDILAEDPGEPIQPNLSVGPTGLLYAIVGQHVSLF